MTGLSRALVLVAGIAHAMPALAVEWTQYRIQDTARRCAGLPAEFAVAASSDRRWVAMQAPGQLWHWQRNAAGEVVQVQFWAQDLGAGVLWRDPLELAAAPPVKEFLTLQARSSSRHRLACGGLAVPVKRWQAPIPAIATEALTDQSDLADMEGNPIAADLQRRLHQPAHPH